MKIFPILTALLAVVCVPLHADTRTSTTYRLTTETVDAGGLRAASASYTNSGSIGLVAGLSTAAAPATTVTSGYLAQLSEATPATPVITSPLSASGTFGSAFAPYTITATNSPASFSATGLPGGLSVNPNTGTITGTPTAAGSFTATLGATNASGTGTALLALALAKAGQTITFAALSARAVGSAPFTVNATATSGLSVGFASTNAAVATVSGNTVTLTGAGSTTITASQAGDANFAAAPNVLQTLTVTPLPVITTQPAAQAVVAGSSATFSVAATNPGAGTLTYRWYFTPTGSATPQALSDLAGRFSGTQTPTLTVSNIQASDTGDYVSVVSNSSGLATSNAALLSLEARSVRIVSQTAAPGAQVTVPVQLLAAGDENTVTFGLQFNPAKLTYVGFAPGTDVAGGTVTPNISQQANGQLGFLIGKAPATVHAAGTRALITLTFTVAPGVVADEIVPLAFVDQPSARKIFAANSAQLPGAFADGRVTATIGLEGDINGDGEVDGGDWVKLGRMVVGLDAAPTSGVAFLRADIAPRAARGDGTVDGGDWVQLGRFVVGLDAPQPAGGPAAPIL